MYFYIIMRYPNVPKVKCTQGPWHFCCFSPVLAWYPWPAPRLLRRSIGLSVSRHRQSTVTLAGVPSRDSPIYAPLSWVRSFLLRALIKKIHMCIDNNNLLVSLHSAHYRGSEQRYEQGSGISTVYYMFSLSPSYSVTLMLTSLLTATEVDWI